MPSYVLRRLARAVSVVLFLLIISCRRTASDRELLIFAAASTSDALTELGRQFEASGGPPTRFSFGSSSQLARQIVAGAPADIFLSADAKSMDELEHAGLVDPKERKDLLSNRLVIVVPESSTAHVDGPESLKSFDKIALGDPVTVPAGIYAQKWLEREGVWNDVKDHVVPALDVRAALAAVEGGHADAGIVYRTDAAIAKHVRTVYEVTTHAPSIVYPLARIKASRNAAAAPFIDLVSGPRGREVFLRYGFVVL
jgi:molybdate transport system substrate-binding protein